MRFTSEKALQDYCLTMLRSQGIPCSDEVWCGNIRADIVTDRAVIELKKILNRESLYQALGQATAYNRHFKRPEIWLVGQRPSTLSEQHQAETLAAEIEKDPSITVSFIETDWFWADPSETRLQWLGNVNMKRSLLLIGGGAIALVVGGIAAFRPMSSNSQSVRSSSTLTLPSLPSGGSPSHSQVVQSPKKTPQLFRPMTIQTPPHEQNNGQAHQLSPCNGRSVPANFRAFPSLSPFVVLGAVLPGQTVYLTGQSVAAEGVIWYEAVGPALHPVTNPNAQNRTAANQVGWIASCFVK